VSARDLHPASRRDEQRPPDVPQRVRIGACRPESAQIARRIREQDGQTAAQSLYAAASPTRARRLRRADDWSARTGTPRETTPATEPLLSDRTQWSLV
jgi:hypothetical protein